MTTEIYWLPTFSPRAIERSPELKDLIENTPVEELRFSFTVRDVPCHIKPEILMELAYDHSFMDMGDNTEENVTEQAVICVTPVVGAGVLVR